MMRPLPVRLGAALLTAGLFLSGAGCPTAEGHGGGGHGGGGHGGGGHGGPPGHGGGGYSGHYGYPGGFYGGGLAPFGYGLGAGVLVGAGLGASLYRPYYGYGVGGAGLGGGGLGYGGSPYYAGYGYDPGSPGMAFPDGTPAPPLAPAPPNRPPADNAAHLQILVPPGAEVVFDGRRTSQKGPVREFVSPPLALDKLYTYDITVRYTDPSGKVVTDRRSIDVRANDWFSIDFTRPAPSREPPLAAPLNP